MLRINDYTAKEKMKNYYRTSDMINLIDFFPNLSPVKDLTIVENIKEYQENKFFLIHLNKIELIQ